MRDPKRIKKILKVLEGVWNQYPDLRLGQLLENALGFPSETPTTGPNHCIFHVEDGDLVLALCEFVGVEKPKSRRSRNETFKEVLKEIRRIKKFIKQNKRESTFQFPEDLYERPKVAKRNKPARKRKTLRKKAR